MPIVILLVLFFSQLSLQSCTDDPILTPEQGGENISTEITVLTTDGSTISDGGVYFRSNAYGSSSYYRSAIIYSSGRAVLTNYNFETKVWILATNFKPLETYITEGGVYHLQSTEQKFTPAFDLGTAFYEIKDGLIVQRFSFSNNEEFHGVRLFSLVGDIISALTLPARADILSTVSDIYISDDEVWVLDDNGVILGFNVSDRANIHMIPDEYYFPGEFHIDRGYGLIGVTDSLLILSGVYDGRSHLVVYKRSGDKINWKYNLSELAVRNLSPQFSGDTVFMANDYEMRAYNLSTENEPELLMKRSYHSYPHSPNLCSDTLLAVHSDPFPFLYSTLYSIYNIADYTNPQYLYNIGVPGYIQAFISQERYLLQPQNAQDSNIPGYAYYDFTATDDSSYFDLTDPYNSTCFKGFIADDALLQGISGNYFFFKQKILKLE